MHQTHSTREEGSDKQGKDSEEVRDEDEEKVKPVDEKLAEEAALEE